MEKNVVVGKAAARVKKKDFIIMEKERINSFPQQSRLKRACKIYIQKRYKTRLNLKHVSILNVLQNVLLNDPFSINEKIIDFSK